MMLMTIRMAACQFFCAWLVSSQMSQNCIDYRIFWILVQSGIKRTSSFGFFCSVFACICFKKRVSLLTKAFDHGQRWDYSPSPLKIGWRDISLAVWPPLYKFLGMPLVDSRFNTVIDVCRAIFGRMPLRASSVRVEILVYQFLLVSC